MDWKQIHVFADGALYDKKKKLFLEQFPNDNGYMCVMGNYGPVCVHRIVANKYCSGRHRGGRQDLVVDHVDNNRLNNNAENLRWVTVDENRLQWRNFQRFGFQ